MLTSLSLPALYAPAPPSPSVPGPVASSQPGCEQLPLDQLFQPWVWQGRVLEILVECWDCAKTVQEQRKNSSLWLEYLSEEACQRWTVGQLEVWERRLNDEQKKWKQNFFLFVLKTNKIHESL